MNTEFIVILVYFLGWGLWCTWIAYDDSDDTGIAYMAGFLWPGLIVFLPLFFVGKLFIDLGVWLRMRREKP